MTAHELYLVKRGELYPKEAGDRADIGNLIEGAIADIFTYKTGTKTKLAPDTVHHPDYDFIACNIDRFIREGIPLEIKSTTMADEWGDESDGANGIPIPVHIQIQHQMMCCEANMAAVAVLLFGSTLKIYEVSRDDELIEMIICKDLKFWDCVQAGTPPQIEYNHATTLDMLRRVYKGTNHKIIDLPGESMDWHEKKVEEAALAKQHDVVAKGYESRIREAMGENAVGLLSDGTGYTRKANKNGVIGMNFTKHPPRES